MPFPERLRFRADVRPRYSRVLVHGHPIVYPTSGHHVMPTNIGTPDRAVRALLGIALLLLVVMGPRSYWGLIGLIPLLTAVTGFCPLYAIFGISTARRRA